MNTIDNEATQFVNNNESTIVNKPAQPAEKKAETPAAKETEKKTEKLSTVQAAAAAGVAGAGLGASAALFSSAIPIDESAIEADVATDENNGTQSEQSQMIAPEDVQVASSVNDSMSFNEAFAAARHEVGPDGVFEWRGQLYNTHLAGEENHTPANVHIEHDPVAIVDPEPVPAPISEPEPEVEILGVVHDDETGANFGAIAVDGQEVIYVDVDGDYVADIIATDLNNDGSISEDEMADISGANISMSNFEVGGNDIIADNDTPDYINDGDVDMFA